MIRDRSRNNENGVPLSNVTSNGAYAHVSVFVVCVGQHLTKTFQFFLGLKFVSLEFVTVSYSVACCCYCEKVGKV